mmetsp:Transcript_756/g.924  ORF Transcript_756/g.924 Transcript_756/m.924 type:complete len:753 (+) Transcript_756:106-2364(+)
MTEEKQAQEAELPSVAAENGTEEATEDQNPTPVSVKSQPDYVIGIDFGTDTAVVSLASTKAIKPEILRNDISNQKTPVVISFQGSERCFGDLAKQVSTANRESTISGVIRSVGVSADEFKSETPYCTSKVEQGESGLEYQIKYDGKDLSLKPESVIASFLSKFEKFAKMKMKDGETAVASVVIPDSFTDSQKGSIKSASKIAGVEVVQLIDRSAAVALTYGTKRSEENIDNGRIMYVDVGHGYVTVSLYKWNGKTATRLAAETVSNLGSAIIDEFIFDELNKECESKYGQKISKSSKGAIRLRAACRKLKEILSGVPEANITCENLIDGQDIRFSFSREKLERICSDSRDRMLQLVNKVLSDAGTDEQVTACELVGGGFRVPWVKSAIVEALGEDTPLSYTLDSMAAASTGAAFAAASLYEPTGGIRRPAFDNLARVADNVGLYSIESIQESHDEQTLTEAKDLHEQMEASDLEAARKKEARNKLEAFIFETRSAASGGGKFSELIIKEECNTLLNQAEEWLYDYEEGGSRDDISAQNFIDKYDELKAALEPSCGKYLQAVKDDIARKDKELEEAAAKAAAELEASGGKDDHDFRKLSKPDRMKKVVLNKEEGTSLFKDGNYEPASLRYKRALQHCEKFFDLSEDDKKEVDGIKLSLHLNTAMCHIKLEAWDFAMKQLDEAITLDPNSCKALYRRALVLERKKDFDEARKELLKAKKIEPDDKAVARLMERVEIQIKRQKAKAKKMAQKMFG